MTLSVDVVIPVHNGWDVTDRCLEHLSAQTVPITVTVCDNGSTDSTAARIREERPQVRVVELGANRGFAAACNRGVMDGEGEVVVLLNNDVQCPPDFIERLAAPFAHDSRLGSVAATLVAPSADVIDSAGLAVDFTMAGFARLRGAPLRRRGDGSPMLVGPCGGAAAYRRAAWNEVGGLDDAIFFYAEDVDLAVRLRRAGWSTTLAADAIAVHLGSHTAQKRSGWQRYQGGFSRGYLVHRYGVLRSPACARTLITEAVVVAADSVLSRDLAALRGRLAGWRAAGGAVLPPPSADVADTGITLIESMRLRYRDIQG